MSLLSMLLIARLVSAYCVDLYYAVPASVVSERVYGTRTLLKLGCSMPVMPISHRRHGQDKTVFTCFVRVGGVN